MADNQSYKVEIDLGLFESILRREIGSDLTTLQM
jgi:hypothetical protein